MLLRFLIEELPEEVCCLLTSGAYAESQSRIPRVGMFGQLTADVCIDLRVRHYGRIHTRSEVQCCAPCLRPPIVLYLQRFQISSSL